MGTGTAKPIVEDTKSTRTKDEKAASSSQKEKPKPDNSEDLRDKYDLGEVLGSGSFGQVREARLKANPDIVRAVKIIENDTEGGDWSNSAMFRKEVGLLQKMNHPNIVAFWDVYEDKHFLYVVMDVCKGGEVFSKIIELKRFTEANAATLGAQMLASIDYVHKKEIMHRDIKAENFLLSDTSPTSVVKMIDFGMACKFGHGQVFTEICGSPHYLAPELIGQKYNRMVDMWAFGVLLYLIMYGHYPFDSKNTREIMVKVLTEPIKWQTKAKLHLDTIAFLKLCLEQSPKKRIKPEDALKHKWVTSAASPDVVESSEKAAEPAEDLGECIRSAHKKITSSKKEVDKAVDKMRTDKLVQINNDFKKGIRCGTRLGETPKEDFMSKPEFIRRDNRLTTAPSRAIQQAVNPISMLIAGAAKATATATAAVTRKPNEGKVTRFAPERDTSEVDMKDSKPEPESSADAASPPEERAAPQRKNKQAKTTRLMYIGDMEQDEEKNLKEMWEKWRKEDAGKKPGHAGSPDGCQSDGLSSPCQSHELLSPGAVQETIAASSVAKETSPIQGAAVGPVEATSADNSKPQFAGVVPTGQSDDPPGPADASGLKAGG
mmetsp:Transcript_96590/g.174405  ORF Transcript_96590/g.174405 Transcript_96590/m.174405 type:complete len:603 (+) Transcript_96590:133-1941(+)